MNIRSRRSGRQSEWNFFFDTWLIYLLLSGGADERIRVVGPNTNEIKTAYEWAKQRGLIERSKQ